MPAPPPLSADGRYGLQVLVGTLDVYAEPNRASAIIAQLQEGAQIEALERRDAWYRITLSDGRAGWVDYVFGKTGPNFSVDATPAACAQRRGSPSRTRPRRRHRRRRPMRPPTTASCSGSRWASRSKR